MCACACVPERGEKKRKEKKKKGRSRNWLPKKSHSLLASAIDGAIDDYSQAIGRKSKVERRKASFTLQAASTCPQGASSGRSKRRREERELCKGEFKKTEVPILQNCFFWNVVL